jgi:hypothetical protein
VYFVDLFPVPALAASAVDATLALAVDADVRDSDRVVALHNLRGVDVSERGRVARALVAVLNEELHWVPSEALLVIDALAPALAIGVDNSGSFRASPTPRSDLVDDGEAWHCPVLGRVAVARDVDVVEPAWKIPWLARKPARFVVEVGGERRAVRRASRRRGSERALPRRPRRDRDDAKTEAHGERRRRRERRHGHASRGR